MWRKAVVRQGFPVGKQGAAQIGVEKVDFFEQALRVGGVGGDDGSDAAGRLFALSQLGQQEGIGRAHRAGQGKAFSGGKRGQMHKVVKIQKPP